MCIARAVLHGRGMMAGWDSNGAVIPDLEGEIERLGDRFYSDAATYWEGIDPTLDGGTMLRAKGIRMRE